ncbi:hypothetical protein FIBSPDRAFT_113426 [Athelia psychrophila]|uniref:Uncharacterized protein n=1 Tax=Athelia psychrophila TaxID=1759441 RepID=A0A166D3J0_9AGAM|nr:hypothetical protein FIBSPDRAFT_113426 [Fibularhizoctonia sp. CBS 109695]
MPASYAAAQDSRCDGRATASDLEQAQAQAAQRPGLLRESPTIPPPVLAPSSCPRYLIILSMRAQPADGPVYTTIHDASG